ncbi:MAG: hypothetical protein P1U56_23990 [Saprospiraceae bacterium]|nr:hypothetical protein [Saprospiraceae bacterium]
MLMNLDANGQAVDSRGLKLKNINIQSCTTLVDSLTLAPSSITIIHQSDTITQGYTIQNNSLIWDDATCTNLTNQTISIYYRVFPFNIEQDYFHLDSTMMVRENKAIYIGSDYSFTPKGQEIIDAKGLDYNGSFSRGFSVGNSQSLILNSNFNLQLTGDLGNGINVVAAISDDNIPIQPEGNTQLIQEFDRVFIKVSKDKTSIIAGDYNLERPKSYFINYFKKVQGLSGRNAFNLGQDKTIKTDAHFAVSRGKFARQLLNTSEGNQGPYKLTGINGERFLIVLSGSEKVFLDGRLLKRGLDYDYIIDYNRAEITFTPTRLIGRESRIIVEYEYRVQNYLRSVYAANVYYNSPNYDLNFNFYNEQDSKTATGDIVLDSTDLLILGSIGDDLSKANISSIRLANDSTQFIGQIRYRLNPNVKEGDPENSFLEYSTDFSEDLYVATFSETGPNQGRYIIDEQTNVNGRVYKYVGPEEGSYEPIAALIPPEKKQIMSVGANLRPGGGAEISTELSMSNNDINRFSMIGNQNNIGTAGVFNYNHSIWLNKAKKWALKTENFYEYVEADFIPLNPYRNAEFIRDWNLPNQIIAGQQSILNTSMTLARSDSFQLQYKYKSFDIQDTYSGANQNASFRLMFKGLSVDSKIDVLKSEGYGEKTSFIRPLIDISQLISAEKAIRIGTRFEREENKRINNNGTESLLDNSFAFNLLSFYLKNAEANRFHYKLQFNSRSDLFADLDLNALTNSISTQEISSTVKWAITPKHNLSFNFGWRNFDVTQPELLPQTQSSKKTIIGKLEHNLQAFGGLFSSNSNYIINSGQEPKIEYFFEKVEEGQGDYIYVGNADSVLINANFRYAPNLGTGNFIRLSLINNEFITTNNQSLSQSFRIDPKRVLAKSTKKWAKFLRRFSTINTFRISKKVEENETSTGSNFLNFSADAPNLVSYNSLINNTLFFNRGNPSYDIQIGNKVTEVIFTQISGLEKRNVNEYFGRSRIKVFRSTDVILNLKNGTKGYDSALNTFRNLDIAYYSINPEVSYRPSTNTRINLLYKYDKRDQRIGNQEFAKSHDFTMTTTFRKASSSNLNLTLSFVNVQFNGEQNSPIEFDLLEGLKDGKNYIWNTLFTKRLSNSVDLNLSYEGRKTGDAPTIHIARAQIKATF